MSNSKVDVSYRFGGGCRVVGREMKRDEDYRYLGWSVFALMYFSEKSDLPDLSVLLKLTISWPICGGANRAKRGRKKAPLVVRSIDTQLFSRVTILHRRGHMHQPVPFKYGWLLVDTSQRKWHVLSIFRVFPFLPLSILLPLFLPAYTTTLT